MRFRQIAQANLFALLLIVLFVGAGGCTTDASKSNNGLAFSDSSDDKSEGTRLAGTMTIHLAFHRQNARRLPSVTTRDDEGNHFASALRIVDVQDQAKRLPQHLLGQVLCLGSDKANDTSDVMVYVDGFNEIELLYWHDDRLHIIHGPNYTTVISTPGEPAKAQRDDRSMVFSSDDCRTKPSTAAKEDLQEILADRKQSNERRIEALWQLRDMTNEWQVNYHGTGWARNPQKTPTAFDPTKSFITALHNGPDALRAEAARALRMRSVDTQPAIKGLIHRAKNDTNAKVRMEAALTLGYLKAKDAAVELMGSLDDSDDTARIAKVLAIRMINEWELAPAFVNAASERTREGVLLALKDVQEAQAIAALEFAVQNSAYPKIRLQAVSLLVRTAFQMSLIDHAFFSAMSETTLQSLDPALRDFKIPMWLSGRSESPQILSIIEALRGAINDEDPSVRSAAAVSLQRIESRRQPK